MNIWHSPNKSSAYLKMSTSIDKSPNNKIFNDENKLTSNLSHNSKLYIT
jgi:hypothetical protein